MQVHCSDSSAKNKGTNTKAVQDGMWATLVTKSSKDDLIKYVKNSIICMESVFPQIVKQSVRV